MLTSAVLELYPKRKENHPGFTGHMVHDWLFDWIKTIDATQFHLLCLPRQVKPITSSGLIRSQGGSSCVRLTAFEPDHSAWLAHHLWQSLPSSISIGNVDYEVITIWNDASYHPWAGQTTYRHLVEHYLYGSDPGKKFSLFFASPTTFRSRGHNVPLPVPNLLLGSLLDRWHAYAPVTLDKAIRHIAATQVAPSRYNLQTEAVRVKNSLQIGFTGRCEFTVLTENPYWRRVSHLLAAFAFYSGVGAKTAWGMGQVRPIGKNRKDP